MALLGFVGAPFRPFVKNQINVRKEIVSSTERNNEVLAYLNSKTSWVRLSSSVNIDNGHPIGKKLGMYGDSLAKNYILQGGTLYSSPKYGLQLRHGIGADTISAAYGVGGTSEAGLRPMPGIEMVNVKTKNAFGSLREASVKFKCWNRTQLDIMEVLYMKPGYSLLLEWGHTIFYSNGKKYSKGYDVHPIDFFRNGITKEDIYNEIENKQISHGGNYDALFGFIKQFSYTATEDGGYDCIVDIVALGEVLESLKINSVSNKLPFPLVTEKNVKTDGGTHDLVLSKSQQSDLHNILAAIANDILVELDFLDLENYEYNYMDPEKDKSESKKLTPEEIFMIKNGRWKISFVQDGGTKTSTYISLGLFLAILHRKCLLYNSPNDKNFVNINFSILDNIGLSHWLQTSVDPNVCLYPSKAKVSSGNLDNQEFYSSQKIQPRCNIQGVDSRYVMNHMNIPVNIECIISVLDYKKKENGDVYLYDLLVELMSRINYAMGSLNQWLPTYDYTSNFVKISDVQDIPIPNSLKRVEIDPYGKESFIKNFSFNSKIFASMATMIAIGAQNKASTLGVDATSLGYINQNVTNRITPRIEDAHTIANRNKTEQEIREEILQNKVNNTKILTKHMQNITKDKKYSVNDVETCKAILRDYIILLKKEEDDNDSKTKSKNPIPIELNMTMEGLSGIRLGETFHLDKNRLPLNYINEVGQQKVMFLVREISHTISNNSWETTIGGLSIPFKP